MSGAIVHILLSVRQAQLAFTTCHCPLTVPVYAFVPGRFQYKPLSFRVPRTNRVARTNKDSSPKSLYAARGACCRWRRPATASDWVVCSGRAIFSHASGSGDFCLSGVVVLEPFLLGVDTDTTLKILRAHTTSRLQTSMERYRADARSFALNIAREPDVKDEIAIS